MVMAEVGGGAAAVDVDRAIRRARFPVYGQKERVCRM